MKRQLRFKFLFIIAVMLVCLYGIIGVPRSKSELVANWETNIQFADVQVDEAKSLATAVKAAIVVKGVPNTQVGSFRTLVNDKFPQWLSTPLNGTDYRLTMKPSEALQFWQNVLSQSKNIYE